MNINELLGSPDEKPLDRLCDDGGFCSIFRSIGCIGDSLSSGEFEYTDENGNRGYYDQFDFSWGQFIARMAGVKVYNFSRGGMTASEYWNSFAESKDFWNPDKVCYAYIIALGVNDLFYCNQPLGTIDDINFEHPENNPPTFAGYYGKIIARLKSMQPKARFFLMTMVHSDNENETAHIVGHAALLHEIAAKIPNTYVLDFAKYAPVYDAAFREKFFLSGHMNPMGYKLTAKMTASYIDYIVRHNMEDFAQVGFIGTPYSYKPVK